MNLFEKTIQSDTPIPKTFIRVWIGHKEIPELFNSWWHMFKEIHPSYRFVTIKDSNLNELIQVPDKIQPLMNSVDTCAGVSDIVRILALYQIGGVYVDTDVMPLRSFNSLIESSNKPFLAKRSSKSFESAVMGSPKGHQAFQKLIDVMPVWADIHKGRAASVQTGPAFVPHVLFGRPDINHLPMETFYPYNGFKAPSRPEKEKMFSSTDNFPEEMLAAHFSNHRWGGKPR